MLKSRNFCKISIHDVEKNFVLTTKILASSISRTFVKKNYGYDKRVAVEAWDTVYHQKMSNYENKSCALFVL